MLLSSLKACTNFSVCSVVFQKCRNDKNKLFASQVSQEVRIEKNCALCPLKKKNAIFPNANRPRLENNIFIFFLKLNEILAKRTRMI